MIESASGGNRFEPDCAGCADEPHPAGHVRAAKAAPEVGVACLGLWQQQWPVRLQHSMPQVTPPVQSAACRAAIGIKGMSSHTTASSAVSARRAILRTNVCVPSNIPCVIASHVLFPSVADRSGTFKGSGKVVVRMTEDRRQVRSKNRKRPDSIPPRLDSSCCRQRQPFPLDPRLGEPRAGNGLHCSTVLMIGAGGPVLRLCNTTQATTPQCGLSFECHTEQRAPRHMFSA